MIIKYLHCFFIILFQVIICSATPNLVLMGPPGAGKGTFTDMLVQKYNYKQICPGALLREEAAKNTQLGMSIKDLVEHGRPIDPKIVWNVVLVHLEEALSENMPFVLDGYPKNKTCFDLLISYLKEHNLNVQFIHFYADDAICFDRIVSRLECHTCGSTYNLVSKRPLNNGICDMCHANLVQRKGDDHTTALYRLDEFHENIEPLINEIKEIVPVVEVDTTYVPINHCESLFTQLIG